MIAILPIAITSAELTSSNVSEPTLGSPVAESVYSAGTTYALGDYVISTTTHRRYKSLAAGNLGNALTDTTKWQDVGASNKFAMFDTERNLQTEGTSPLIVVITPGERFDSLAITGMEANSVAISISSTIGGGVVYSETVSLSGRDTVGLYTYFFGGFDFEPNLLRTTLPPYSDAVITLTFTRSSGFVKVGPMVVGMKEYLGEAELSPTSDVLNFSTVTRDADGGAEFNAVRNIPLTQLEVWAPKTRVERIRKFRDACNATPAVWSAIDDDTDGYFGALFTLAFPRRFSINLDEPEEARINLELESI